jgi:hypothetical protein
VGGYGDGLYRPDDPVNRAQMATFLVRSAEKVGGPLTATADFFDDDDDDGTHEAAIDNAAGAGIAGGTREGRYSPGPVVRRDQMASFLARTLDLLVHAGHTGRRRPAEPGSGGAAGRPAAHRQGGCGRRQVAHHDQGAVAGQDQR